MLQRLLHGFLESSVFAAAGAWCLCSSTEAMILPSTSQVLNPLHLLLISGVLIAYNLHFVWYRTVMGKEAGTAQVPHHFRLVLMFIGVVGFAYALMHMPSHLYIWLVLLAACAMLYTLPFLPFSKRLKDFGIMKVVVLTMVWTIGTSVLPILYHGKELISYYPEILLRFLFMWSLCLAFDIRDQQVDAKAGIKTLPIIIGTPFTYRFIGLSLLAFVVISLWQYLRLQLPQRLAGEVIIAICTGWAIHHAGKRKGIYNYLLWVDGMMICYGLLVRN